MKVLLISANRVIAPYPVYPLGLDYVAAALRRRHEVKIIDLNAAADEVLEALVRGFAPQIIGISLRNIDNTDAFEPTGYYPEYLRLVGRLRRLSDSPIVLGGSGFTIFPERLMALLAADYGVVGEGERMADLLDAIEQGKDPQSLCGIMTREKQASKVPPPANAFERRFDAQSGYLSFYLQNGGMLNLQTKRGCPFRCIYCTYPHIEGHELRRIDPGEIADTAIELERAGARYLFITDSAFNADVAHSLAVARAFGKVGLKIPWGAFFSPIDLPADYFAILAENGLSHVEFGTESLCDTVLEAYGKPFKTASVFAAHRSAVKAGLNTAHYLLFGGPGETHASVQETLSHIDKLERSVLFLFCGMRIYPNTRLHRIACRQKQLWPQDDLLEPVFYRPSGMSLAEIADLIRAGAGGRPNWVIGAGDQESSGILPLMYRKGYSGPLWEKLIR